MRALNNTKGAALWKHTSPWRNDEREQQKQQIENQSPTFHMWEHLFESRRNPSVPDRLYSPFKKTQRNHWKCDLTVEEAVIIKGIDHQRSSRLIIPTVDKAACSKTVLVSRNSQRSSIISTKKKTHKPFSVTTDPPPRIGQSHMLAQLLSCL